MLTAKELLLKQTAEAFSGRSDMPLMASLHDITQAEASWRPDPSVPTIEQLVRHIAWAKSTYCHQAFAKPMILLDPRTNGDGDVPDLPPEFPCGAGWARDQMPGIDGAIELLRQSHVVLTDCLQSLPDESLDHPLPHRHGKTAAHFFWIMLMHDLYHAGQIRTRRTLYQSTVHEGRAP